MSQETDDAAPFPVKPFRAATGKMVPRSFIPMWMARLVHSRYARYYGPTVTLDWFMANGGLEASHVLDFIAGGNGNGKRFNETQKTKFNERSVKGEVQILVPGTKEYTEAVREMESQEKADKQKAESNLGATGQRLRFFQR